MELYLEQNYIQDWPSEETHTSLVLILNWKDDTEKGNFLTGHLSPQHR